MHKINTDIISYKLVGNWEELNKGLIEHKIECSVCYSLIFWHESLEDRMAPLAYQCNMCQSNLVCGRCAPQLSTCPFCRRDDSVLEPASSIIINEIKKMKFVCHHSQQDDSVCEVKEPMKARELFQHYSFECKGPQKPNRHTLKTRDRNICKYFCELKHFETKQERHFSLNQKSHCMNHASEMNHNQYVRQMCKQHYPMLSIDQDLVRYR